MLFTKIGHWFKLFWFTQQASADDSTIKGILKITKAIFEFTDEIIKYEWNPSLENEMPEIVLKVTV